MTLPFQVSNAIGNKFGDLSQKREENNAIEQILSQAANSGDPRVVQDSIGKILSQVSPERQPQAMKYLEMVYENLKEGKRNEAYQQQGLNPNLPDALNVALLNQRKAAASKKDEKEPKQPLTLNESLNQLEKRYKTAIDTMTRPFIKQDAFGNMFLDLELEEDKRKEVLAKLDKQLKDYTQEVRNQYISYGMDVPGDVEEQLKESINVKMDGKNMTLDDVTYLEELEKAKPAKKNKNVSVTDEKGRTYKVVDGKWQLQVQAQK